MTEIALERSGLRMAPEYGLYVDIIREIRLHTGGEYILAGPDSPEIYFLAAKRNPTRALFDFLTDPVEQNAQTPAELATDRDVGVVVVNTRPVFSDPYSQDLIAELERLYPFSRVLGPYVVRWKAHRSTRALASANV